MVYALVVAAADVGGGCDRHLYVALVLVIVTYHILPGTYLVPRNKRFLR